MNSLALNKGDAIKIAALDILALTAIYMIPTITHMLSFPIYLIEPMRIMLILALVHTRKENAYFLALTLPAFSFLISGHPMLPKMILITFELLLNVWLFITLGKVIKSKALSMLSAVILSKLFYYGVKILLISFAVINTDIISTPIWIQLVMAILFAGYIGLLYKNKDK